MKKELFRPLFFALVSIAVCSAQTPPGSGTLVPAKPPASSPASDAAWGNVAALQKAAISPSALAPGLSLSPTQTAARQQQRAQSFRQTAAAAKDFYTRYPDHPQVPTARRLEALSAISGITDNDKANETAALKIAGDFRSNKANPISDRYLVAHAVERFQVGRKLGGKSWLSSPVEAEGLADRLHAEFGHLPEVYGNYLSIAEHTTCDNSRDVAQRLLQMPAPAPVKAAAQRVLDRWSLLRKPLDFPLTTVDGRATRLSALAGERTVVIFWAGDRALAGPPALYGYSKNPPSRTNWVYVSLGAWTPPAPAAKGAKVAIKANAAPPGTYCVEPNGLGSALAMQLKISQLPFVCVLDEKKNLNAFGRVDEIPAMLAGINRLFEP